MRTGRPAKPTEMKRRQGTLRKHRENRREPKLPLGAPAAPDDLDAIALAEWRRLVADVLRLKVLTESDRPILKLAAQAYSTWWTAELALRKAKSLTFTTKNVTGARVIKARPECALASDAWRRYFNAAVQLGLTPAARGKVSEVDSGDAQAPESKYFQ